MSFPNLNIVYDMNASGVSIKGLDGIGGHIVSIHIYSTPFNLCGRCVALLSPSKEEAQA